jgi:hypothetical protein
MEQAAITKREALLHRNPAALEAVRRGLEQARAGELTDGPDLAQAAKVAKRARRNSAARRR